MTVSDWGPDSPADDARPRFATGGPVPGAVFVPAGCVLEPRTPVPADTEERDGREALSDDHRRQLAAIIAHPKMPADERRYIDGDACDRCPRALAAADAVLGAGFRLVSDDEATVDRVAAALREDETAAAIARAYLPDWEHCRESTRESYRVLARAAVRALREAGQ